MLLNLKIMLLVADSGSTKADWLLFDGEKITGPIHTMGFNPFFHSSEFVLESLMKSEEMLAVRDQITSVKFFGAGCSSDDRNEMVIQWEKLMWEYQQALPTAKPGEKWVLMKKIFTLSD